MGFKKNPEHFKTMLGNINAILTIPVHGCAHDHTLALTHAPAPRELMGVIPPQHPLSGQRRRQHVPGGVRLGGRLLPHGHPLLGHGRRRRHRQRGGRGRHGRLR